MSWDKLGQIEDWLSGPGRRASSSLRMEAHLELAEGRLHFARSDRDRLPATTIRSRLEAARADFQAVLASHVAGSAHRSRAARGLNSLATLERGLPASGGPFVRLAPLSRQRWGAAPANSSRLTANDHGWTRITVHHSARPAAAMRGASVASVAEELRRYQKTHMGERGWGDIGYHYLIDPSGRVFEGRSLRWQGAHAGGNNNRQNLGVCLLGNFEDEHPTSAALAALDGLIGDFRTTYNIPRERVYGHRELKVTACPGRNLTAWVERYRGGRSSPVAHSPTPSKPSHRSWSQATSGRGVR